MTLTIEALDRQHRREANRRLAVATVLLCSTGVLSLAAAGSTKLPQAHTATTVTRLQDQNRAKDDQLLRLRQLFTYCRSSIGWTDDRCGNPTGGAAVGNVPVDARVVRVTDSSDSSDNSDGGTRVVVQQPRPTASPSRGSQ